MKLSDIVFLKSGEPAGPVSEALSAQTGLFALSDREVSGFSNTVCIADEKGSSACIDKDLLVYLREKCHPEALASVLDLAPIGVVAIDDDSRIFFTNNGYTDILGVPRQRVLGRRMCDIEPDAAILRVVRERTAFSGKTVHIQSINRYVKVSIHPLELKGRPWGAVSFFTDVTENTSLKGRLKKAETMAEHLRETMEKEQAELPKSFDEMIGRNHRFVELLKKAHLVAATDAPVLIQGEHGVGKEVLARAMHADSPRRNSPFIAVNCAAIPEALLESELFGYVDGAFTGARKGGRLGKFELADKGTLFLDEIGDMPLPMQAKLLRALQQKEIEKIGREQPVVVDVRIIAATNKQLQEQVERKEFRADLLYRLNVVSLTLPPLRERLDDIGLLVGSFVEAYNVKYSKTLSVSPLLHDILQRHVWPGNIRELANILEYAYIMCPGGDILPDHLPAQFSGMSQVNGSDDAFQGSWREVIERTERRLLEEALRAYPHNRSAAIRRLGLSRKAFYDKLKRYHLD